MGFFSLFKRHSPQSDHSVLDIYTLIEIPAGPFQIGTDKAFDKIDRPMRTVTLPNYWIGKTPVTVAQFQAFVQASRYKWGGVDKKQGGADHPVVYVNWHDAQAFCQWLTGVWRTSGKIGADQVVCLPCEAEWEKAARGTDGRPYPWGYESPNAQRCNYNNCDGTTTPVGKYSPLGDSPYGCVDMVGNVWEIMRNHLYFYPRSDGEVLPNEDSYMNDAQRAIRGACYLQSEMAICNRSTQSANKGGVAIGFRVVVISTSLIDNWLY